MCHSLHTSFFHKCGHSQFVWLPSLNPACERQKESFTYFENKYCPRCSWKGRLFPFVIRRVYEEVGPGIECQGLTGNVTRTVRIPWYDWYKYTKETLWVARRNAWSQTHMFLSEQVDEAITNHRESPGERDRPDMFKTYFLRLSKPNNLNPSPDFYTPFGDDIDMIPEDQDTCPICQCRTDLGTNHEDSCRGSGYVDAAGNLVGGEPVILFCGHIFGLGCIRSWMEGPPPHDSCPSCRNDFVIIRDKPYFEPPEWAYQELSVRRKIDYNLQYARNYCVAILQRIWLYLVGFANYPWVLVEEYQVWFEDIRVQTLRLQQWREVLEHDWNNLAVWPGIIRDYYVFMFAPVSLLSSAPFWMTWTNILLATFGLLIFWWVRPRPFNDPNLDTTKNLKRFIWFGFAGNFIEWLVVNISEGWFSRFHDAFLAMSYLIFIFLVVTQSF